MLIQRTNRYVNIAAAISIAVLLAGISTLAVGIQRTAESWRRVSHTHEVLQHVQGTQSLINEADALQKSLRLEYSRRDDADFQERLTALPRELNTLKQLTSDNATQQRTLADLRGLLDDYVRNLRTGMERGLAYPSREDERALRQTIAMRIAALQAEEERLLMLRDAAAGTDRARTVAAAVAVSVLSVALLFFVRAMARRDADFLAAQRANLDATLRSIGEAVIAVDVFGRVRFMNRVAEQLLGCEEGEARDQLLTTVFRIARSSADDDALAAALRAALREKQPVTGIPIAGSSPAQPERMRFWLLNCQPLLVDGEVRGAVMSMLDVTELKRVQRELGDANTLLEQRIQDRTEQLAEANIELRAFAHTIAHDLRAPLRNVQGYAAALLEDEAATLSATGERFVRRILAVSQHMDRLVTDLLAYSQLSRAELRLQPVELDRVVQLALGGMETQIAAAGARVDAASPLPTVLGNEAVLVQVFDNLIGNAIKFVAPGVTPHVRIDADLTADAAWVRIADNGIGIPEDKRERVFDVFERLHGEEQYQGTGIGLAIVKKGVERLGGTIRVEPASAGTVFRLCLQRPRPQPLPAAAPADAPPVA
ncbi:ATP-binding protein [Telluria mixta]|uniref:histidine kinase n=1 Tax=Telluria mixta TaxID=34071 RepID=A0ABT2C978_9BURK|nr:ATP-binding protein [Telluria mixta]MCS0633885.1 ATP-binding protein [Telluria mixta]WEM95502.1 ATP-binding protein [Telluria mixta]